MVIGAGLLVGIGGGVIHGATAVLMLRAQAAGAAWRDPLADVLSSGVVLPMLWAVAVAAALCASAVLVYAALAGRFAVRRTVVVVNPVLVTVLLVALALVFDRETLGQFLAPSAPNLAHVLFFAVAAVNIRPRRADSVFPNP